MIIDCHTHLNRYDDSDPPSLAERRDALREAMQRHGIAQAIIITSYHDEEDRPDVCSVLEAVRDHPSLHVVGGVDCEGGVPRNLDVLAGLLREGRLRGLKLYPGYQPFYVHDAALRPVYELAAEHRVPVMIHTGDTYNAGTRVRQAHPLTVDDIAVDFREVTFVLCHAGNPWYTDAMEVLYKNENVVADISGLTLGEFQPRYEAFVRAKLAEVTAYINVPDKLLFGSDWPLSDLTSYLGFASRLEMTAEEREGLMWRNAARVFGLDTAIGGGDG